MRRFRIRRPVRAILGGVVVSGAIVVGGAVTIAGAAAVGAFALVLKSREQVRHQSCGDSKRYSSGSMQHSLGGSATRLCSHFPCCLQRHIQLSDQQQAEEDVQSESKHLHSAKVSSTSNLFHR